MRAGHIKHLPRCVHISRQPYQQQHIDKLQDQASKTTPTSTKREENEREKGGAGLRLFRPSVATAGYFLLLLRHRHIIWRLKKFVGLWVVSTITLGFSEAPGLVLGVYQPMRYELLALYFSSSRK